MTPLTYEEWDEMQQIAKRHDQAAIRRLKQRIARILRGPIRPNREWRRDINRAIDAWHDAEQKRGGL